MKSTVQFVIQLFWSCWFTIVAATNVLDGLKALGLLPSEWKMASGNYENILHTTSIYQVPRFVNAILFSGVIGWELTCTCLFWVSLTQTKHLSKAFTASVSLFSAFILASELFLDYAVANAHIRILILLIVSYIACKDRIASHTGAKPE